MEFHSQLNRSIHSGEHRAATKVLAVASGKGGVGKSTLVANLGVELARQGKRVLLMDGDFGLANLDVMFGIRPDKTIFDLIENGVSLSKVLIPVMPNLSLIPGGSGIYKLQRLGVHAKRALLDQITELGNAFDWMIIDTSPGIDDNVQYLTAAAQKTIVVLTPDPASLTDAYALIKTLHQIQREKSFDIVCNQVRDELDGSALFDRINNIASRFLNVKLNYRGCIPADPQIRALVRAQRLVAREAPASPGGRAIHQLALGLVQSETDEVLDGCKGTLQFFWTQLLGDVRPQVAY